MNQPSDEQKEKAKMLLRQLAKIKCWSCPDKSREATDKHIRCWSYTIDGLDEMLAWFVMRVEELHKEDLNKLVGLALANGVSSEELEEAVFGPCELT